VGLQPGCKYFFPKIEACSSVLYPERSRCCLSPTEVGNFLLVGASIFWYCAQKGVVVDLSQKLLQRLHGTVDLAGSKKLPNGNTSKCDELV
jgi:hypothetical protein